MLALSWLFLVASDLWAGEVEGPAKTVGPFLQAHCVACHDATTKKGGLDLEALGADLSKPDAFRAWVKVHDKVRSGDMPPPKRKRPPQAEADAVLADLDAALVAADRKSRPGGRAVLRRLNRVEYENTLRDLFSLPGLSVRDLLPEDGRANGFDKTGTALDLSYVQLAKYMEAADAALDVAIAPFAEAPAPFRKRLYAGQEYHFGSLLMNGDAVFLKDMKYDDELYPIVRDESAAKGSFVELDKLTKSYKGVPGNPYPGTVGVFRHVDPSNHLSFGSQFTALVPGRYRLKLSVWGFQWQKGEVKDSPRTEALTLSVNGRLLGNFDAPSLKPTVQELEVWLNAKEFIEVNAASLWPHVYVHGLPGRAAAYVGPGIAIDWLEVEGPLYDAWPPNSHRRLFGELPLVPLPTGAVKPPRRTSPDEWFVGIGLNRVGKFTYATVASRAPLADAERLLSRFLPHAFRRPVTTAEVGRYMGIVKQRLAAKACFEDAMRTAYKAALCSPSFLFLKETPGQLTDVMLASRLSYFLWGSMPDPALTALARKGTLHDPKTLRDQVERLLSDPKGERFIDDFLDQWLDLRDINATTPDPRLYPEFHPLLRDAMIGEPRAYFRELLTRDLGVAYLVHSDFAMLNQKLAELYGVSGVSGTAFRRVALPPDLHRGGFLTQASVLKVTANGTTTTPVKRGAWVERKILGQPPDPPPPNVPAVEPDVRGTTTIREQLAAHRSNVACVGCHAKIDPPGFALESFDVIGGWRQRYRKLPPTGTQGFLPGPAVDSTGELSAGKVFADVDQLKKLLLDDERQIARNFVGQLVVYATGAPVGYADRAAVEHILDRAQPGHYGLRTLIHEVVQSPLFQNK